MEAKGVGSTSSAAAFEEERLRGIETEITLLSCILAAIGFEVKVAPRYTLLSIKVLFSLMPFFTTLLNVGYIWCHRLRDMTTFTNNHLDKIQL